MKRATRRKRSWRRWKRAEEARHGESFRRDERDNIDKLEKALRAVMNKDDYQAIRTAIDTLNQGTMRLAELMMDSAVGAALKGKNMDDARTLAKGRPRRIPSLAPRSRDQGLGEGPVRW